MAVDPARRTGSEHAAAGESGVRFVRTVLMCHAGDAFDREGLAAWLASFSDLAGIVVIEETAVQKRARIKQLLARRIYRIPRHGSLVMHPGICPEYRKAHGCFWALAERDLDRVGLT